MFLPAGEQAVGFMKGFAERELDKAGIKLIATGDVTEDGVIEAMGDAPLGVITTQHYWVHDGEQNRIFLKAYAEVAGTKRRAISWRWAPGTAWRRCTRWKRLNGKIDGDKAMEVLKGMKIDSPRGPLEIDPATRDPIETIYVRRVERLKDGKFYNVEFDKFLEVKDPNN